MKSMSFLITLIAAVLLGLNAGFFYTWSFTIMQALDVITPDHAIEAMQSINRNVRNGWFATIFFGAPVISILALVVLAVQKRWPAAAWAALSVGAIAVTVATTMLYHVPWNEALAEVVISPAGQDAAGIWKSYSAQWTATNHVRTVASSIAFLAMLFCLNRVFVR